MGKVIKLSTYRVCWQLTGSTELRVETVKANTFNKMLALIRQKYKASIKSCDTLIVHEILNDGSVLVLLEHEENQTVYKGKSIKKPAEPMLPALPYTPYKDMLEGYDDVNEIMEEIGKSLGASCAVRPLKNKRATKLEEFTK